MLATGRKGRRINFVRIVEALIIAAIVSFVTVQNIKTEILVIQKELFELTQRTKDLEERILQLRLDSR